MDECGGCQELRGELEALRLEFAHKEEISALRLEFAHKEELAALRHEFKQQATITTLKQELFQARSALDIFAKLHTSHKTIATCYADLASLFPAEDDEG